jgi:hypothetical protein
MRIVAHLHLSYAPESMKVELLVTRDSWPCRKAENLWRSICENETLTFTVIDDTSPEGRGALARLGLRALPAVLLDGRLVAVGVQTRDQALALLRAAGHADS